MVHTAVHPSPCHRLLQLSSLLQVVEQVASLGVLHDYANGGLGQEDLLQDTLCGCDGVLRDHIDYASREERLLAVPFGGSVFQSVCCLEGSLVCLPSLMLVIVSKQHAWGSSQLISHLTLNSITLGWYRLLWLRTSCFSCLADDGYAVPIL